MTVTTVVWLSNLVNDGYHCRMIIKFGLTVTTVVWLSTLQL